jgi:hypothetical protein
MDSPCNSVPQAGDSTLPVDAALSNRLTCYRRIGWVTGCAFLAIAAIACVCIFVTALPLLPVFLVGVTIGATLATACIWSIYRLKKLNGEPKKQQTPLKPPEEEKPPVAIPKKENTQTGVSEPLDRKTNPDMQRGVSEIPSPETSFEGEQAVIGTSEQKKIPDIPKPPREFHATDEEPPASGKENPQPPIDQVETQESADKPEPQQSLLEATLYGQSDIAKFSYKLHANGEKPPRTGGENPQPQIPARRSKKLEKMQNAKGVNDPKVTEQLRTAQVLYFYGTQDNKFFFKCAQTTGKSEPKICFSADNIEDMWEKSGSAICFRFLCNPPSNFKIPGDNLPNLKSISFSSKEIKEIEIEHHLTGSFKELERITFRNCNTMHTAKINGGWTAKKLEHVTFENCPAVDEIYVGTNLGSQGHSCCQVYTYPEGRTFGGKSLHVRLCGCRKLFKKQKVFSTIEVNSRTISGEINGIGKSSDVTCIMCSNTGTFGPKEANIQKAANTSTILLHLPDIETRRVNLERETIESHTLINFNLKKCKTIILPKKKTIKRLEFTRLIADCQVEFGAHENGTALEINDFPQNSTGDNGEPFKMSFQTWKNSKLPTIKLNNVILKNIKWYKLNESFGAAILFPVTPRNQKDADKCSDWTAIESESAWNGGETVVINSAFLLP